MVREDNDEEEDSEARTRRYSVMHWRKRISDGAAMRSGTR